MKKLRTALSLLLAAAMLIALAVPALAAAEISLTNGDFENGTENWVLVGYSGVKTDAWASNNTTSTLDLWLSDTDATAALASYSVSLSAGTYYFTFDMAGAAMDSGMSYSVSAGDTVLVSGDSTVTTTGWDVWQTVTTKEFTLSEAAEVTFALSGTQTAAYWGNLDNLKLYGDGSIVDLAPDPVQADIYVPYVSGTDGDFMRGMDVSSVLSILNSGATFKDYEGNTLDGQGFFNLLAATGTNWVRLRVWNDPFDADGNGYGGGNCDLEAAKTMGLWATNAGLRVMIDFHYSDFWADPGKQDAPKAWADYTVAQKETAVYDFTYDSVKYLVDSGVDVGMVQVGNETTGGICGVTGWENMCTLFSAGSSAVRAVDEDILVAIHFTNPEKEGTYATYASQLNTYSVDYDVFASSYYPYWHGTLTNLTSVLKNVADTYGKKVIVAETSWGFTLEDGDGHSNTVREGTNDSGDYAFSVQGQAYEISAVAKAVRNVGTNGAGVFYWEPAWIPVQVYDASASDAEQTLTENKALWEQYGSGWASSYAVEYDPDDAGVWYGGSSWDNQALFDFDGTPLDSLKTYQYMQTGTTGYVVEVSEVENPTLTYIVGDSLSLPETVAVSYTVGDDQQMQVTWNTDDVAAVDMNTPGTYTVNGTVGDGLTTVCTVEVKAENLLTNPGFETSDMSVYTISQTYAKRATDDPYAGSYSLHFYSADTVSFTAEQTVTLQPGSYSFSLYGQGGDMGDSADCYAYVKCGDETLTEAFSLTGWAAWTNPTVLFSVDEETAVTVGISVTASQGGAWGTFDEWYLCAAAEEPHTHSHTGSVTTDATCTVDGVKTFICGCGDSYTESIPATGHSYTDGICTNCGGADPDYVEPVTATAYFINSGEWDEAYAYVWNASQQYDVAWPGTVMTGTGETVNGFDVYEITVDASYINIIFHDNLGNQTADLTLMDGQYYNFANNTWYESVDDIPGNETSAETMTIYFQNNWLWDDICLYYWGSAAAEDPAWPGIPMELYGNDGNYDVYCLEVPTDITGMIINGIMNDGSGERDKTPDIEGGWYDGICYYMLWNDGNAAGSEDIGVILPDSDTPTYTIYFDFQGADYSFGRVEYHCEEHWDNEVRYSADFEYDSNTGLWAATFRGSCSEGCVEQISFELYLGNDCLPVFTEDLIDGKTYTVPSGDPTVTRKGSTLSYEDLVYVIDIFSLENVDLTAVDLSKDAGLLVWSVEEFEALTEVAYDEAHANPGLKAYGDTGYYYGASDGIYTRYLHEEACYVGYVKLPDGTYIYSQEKVYSPADYAYNMLGKEDTSENTKTLCVALLNYISAAQNYFYPETTPVNEDLTDEQKALTWDNPELNLAPDVPADKQVDRDDNVFAGRGKNLLFEEMISLVSVYKIDASIVGEAQECGTIFWTAEQFEALTGAPSVENYGEGSKVTGFNVYQGIDGQWYSAAPAVAPKDMADTQYYILGYVIHSNGSVSYSGVMSYTFEQYIANMASNAKMGEFAQRLYYYERAAQAALG